VRSTSLDSPPWPRLWPLLLPLAYLVHLAEEQWTGGGFPAWVSSTVGAPLTEARFVVINAVAWPLALGVCAAAVAWPKLCWPVLAVAAVLALNGAVHLLGSLATASDSPGVVSGVLVYLPLGLATLRRGRGAVTPGAFLGALLTGVALHGVVVAVAFAGG
jgi:hypothetical protein